MMKKDKSELLDAEFIKAIHLLSLSKIIRLFLVQTRSTGLYQATESTEQAVYTFLLTDQAAFGVSSPLPVTNPTWRRTVEAYSFSG